MPDVYLLAKKMLKPVNAEMKTLLMLWMVFCSLKVVFCFGRGMTSYVPLRNDETR